MDGERESREVSQATQDDGRKISLWATPSAVAERLGHGVAGHRFGSGQGNAQHALMAKLLASKPRPKLFHLT